MANLDVVTLRSTLSDYLHFNNGKTSPQRTVTGLVEVFGSNGSIGKADIGNFEGPVVIIGRVGSYCGSLHYSPDMVWVTDNAIACRPQRAEEARYWYYALQTLGLNGRSSGSGQPLLNQTVLGQIPFSPPETAERRAIAEVLGALDDKIVANSKLVRTADELAGSLTRHLLDFENLVPLSSVAIMTMGSSPLSERHSMRRNAGTFSTKASETSVCGSQRTGCGPQGQSDLLNRLTPC